MAGYAFARFRFPGRNALFVIVLAMLMVPQNVLIIPLFELVVGVELVNTLPASLSILLVYLVLQRQFMRSLSFGGLR